TGYEFFNSLLGRRHPGDPATATPRSPSWPEAWRGPPPGAGRAHPCFAPEGFLREKRRKLARVAKRKKSERPKHTPPWIGGTAFLIHTTGQRHMRAYCHLVQSPEQTEVLTEQAEVLRKAADDGRFAVARRRCRGYACSRRSSVRGAASSEAE